MTYQQIVYVVFTQGGSMIDKLTTHKVTLISANIKDDIYDDSWKSLYKYACVSCGEFNRCPYTPFRFYDSRVCLRRKSYDNVDRINIYCDIDDPIYYAKFVAFMSGQTYDK